MTPVRSRIAIGLGAAALLAAAVVLFDDASPLRPRSDVASGEVAPVGSPASPGATEAAPSSPADAGSWDPEGEDPDAAAWSDPAVRALRVHVVARDQRPAPGVPVVVLGASGETLLAGPKHANREGRVRFPITIAMEQEREILVAARAVPGTAVSSGLRVAVDRTADVTLTLDPGLRALVQVADPEGRPVGGARVRKVILGETGSEPGAHGSMLARAFAELTPVAVRRPDGFELLGLQTPEDFTLAVTARGFAPHFQPVSVPREAHDGLPIDVRLGARTSFVRFELVPPTELGSRAVSFSCRRIDVSKPVNPIGVDEVPPQSAPGFTLELMPDAPQRLEAHAWADGQICALAELEIPALREGEDFDAGRVPLTMLPIALGGVVVDQDQRPLAGAVVDVVGRGSTDCAVTTGEDGRFIVRAPSGRGFYQVSAHATGRASETVEQVPEGTLDLRFVLDLSGSIRGAVAAVPGLDPARVSIRVVTAGRAPMTTGLRADGTFEIGGLPRGVYTVTIEGEGIEPIRVADVVVHPPRTTCDGRLELLRPKVATGPRQP